MSGTILLDDEYSSLVSDKAPSSRQVYVGGVAPHFTDTTGEKESSLTRGYLEKRWISYEQRQQFDGSQDDEAQQRFGV